MRRGDPSSKASAALIVSVILLLLAFPCMYITISNTFKSLWWLFGLIPNAIILVGCIAFIIFFTSKKNHYTSASDIAVAYNEKENLFYIFDIDGNEYIAKPSQIKSVTKRKINLGSTRMTLVDSQNSTYYIEIGFTGEMIVFRKFWQEKKKELGL